MADAMSKALKRRRNRTPQGANNASYTAKEKATWSDHDKAQGQSLRIREPRGNPSNYKGY